MLTFFGSRSSRSTHCNMSVVAERPRQSKSMMMFSHSVLRGLKGGLPEVDTSHLKMTSSLLPAPAELHSISTTSSGVW